MPEMFISNKNTKDGTGNYCCSNKICYGYKRGISLYLISNYLLPGRCVKPAPYKDLMGNY